MDFFHSTEWLLSHLEKSNPSTLQPCVDLNLPKTLIYRWNKPSLMYSTKTGDKIISKDEEEHIVIDEFKRYLSMHTPPQCAATLIRPKEGAKKGDSEVTFEYFSRE